MIGKVVSCFFPTEEQKLGCRFDSLLGDLSEILPVEQWFLFFGRSSQTAKLTVIQADKSGRRKGKVTLDCLLANLFWDLF